MTLFSSFHNFSSKKGAGPSRICLLLSACAGLPLLAEESRSTETGAAIELPRLVVDASKGGEEESYNANVGTLGAINIKDAPFSISVLDSGEMSRLQATSASEAFRYTPSVHPMLGTNRASDYFLIRGFNNSPLSGDGGAVDGLRTYTLVNPLEDKERLEVIDGPASLLFGMSSPSGMVNYVLKRPTNTPFSSFQLGVSGGRQVYGHADLGGPLDEQHRFGYRLNFLWTGKGSMAVPGQTHKRYLLSGAFDYHLDRQTTLSLDVSRFAREYEDCQAIFLIGSTTITKLPHAPDPSKNYGAPYGYGQDDYLRAGLGSSSRFGKDTSVRTRLTYVIDDNKSPNYRDNFINNQGDYTAVIYDKGLHRTETTQANAFVETVFETGSIEHKLNAGLVGDYVRYLNPFGKPTATYNSSGFLSSLSLSNPAYAPLSSFGTLDVTSGAPYNNTENTYYSAATIADEMTLNGHFLLLAGLSYASLMDDSRDTASNAPYAFLNKSRLTPGLGLTWKPLRPLSVYVSYLESLQNAGRVSSSSGYANGGAPLPPYLARQVEAGSKLLLGNWYSTLAVFRIEKAAYSVDNANVYGEEGKEIHKGIEWSLQGKTSFDLRINGGITWLDCWISDQQTSKSGINLAGKRPDGVPKQLEKCLLEYGPKSWHGLSLLSGINHMGSMFADATANKNRDTLVLPAYTTVELGLRYERPIGKARLSLSLNITNLSNQAYWTSKGDNMLYLNEPRTWNSSVSIRF